VRNLLEKKRPPKYKKTRRRRPFEKDWTSSRQKERGPRNTELHNETIQGGSHRKGAREGVLSKNDHRLAIQTAFSWGKIFLIGGTQRTQRYKRD